MHPDPKPLSDWLQNPSSETGSLMSQIQRIEALDLALRDWLNTPDPCAWASAIRVAAFEGGTLTVYCADAASLTRFRYRSLEALSFIRQRFGGSCARIEAKVQPLPI